MEYVQYLNTDEMLIFRLTAAAPEPAELDWLEPSRGHFGGKEVVVIKGSKMTSRKYMLM